MDLLNAANSAIEVVSSTVDNALGILGTAATIIEGPNVTLVDQAPAQVSQRYTDVHQVARGATSVDPEVGEYNVQRFVRLWTDDWGSDKTIWSELKNFVLPDVMFNAKFPIANMGRNYYWMRSDFEFQLMVNANAGFAGALLMVYVPHGARFKKTTFMNFPHAILNCSYNTSCSLKVPYVQMRQYVDITGDTDNLGKLFVLVLSYLKVPAGASTSLTVTLYGRVRSPEFQAFKVLEGPDERSRIVQSRGAMYLGGTEGTNNCPATSLMQELSMVDNRVVGAPAVESLLEYAKIPSLIKRFEWKDTDEKLTKLWIDNIQVQYDYEDSDSKVGNLDFLANYYLGYSGDLVVKIVLIGSRLNQGKLLFAFFPGEDVASVDIDDPAKAHNAFLHVVDLGAGTTSDFTLPYVCQQTYRPPGDVHGRLACYVLNKLTYSAASSQIVQVLVFLAAGEGFTYVYPKASEKKFEGMVEDDASKIDPQAPTLRNLKVPGRQILADHMSLDVLKGRAFCTEYLQLEKGVKRVELKPGNRSLGNVFNAMLFYTGTLNVHVLHDAPRDVVVAHSYYTIDVADTDRHFAMMVATGFGAVVVPRGSPTTFKAPFYSLTPFRRTGSYGYLYLISTSNATCNVTVSLSFGEDASFHFFHSPPQYDTSGGTGLTSGDTVVEPTPQQSLLLMSMPLATVGFGTTSVFKNGWYNSSQQLFPPNPTTNASARWPLVAQEMATIVQCHLFSNQEWPHFFFYNFPMKVVEWFPGSVFLQRPPLTVAFPLSVRLTLKSGQVFNWDGASLQDALCRASYAALSTVSPLRLAEHMAATLIQSGDIEVNPGPYAQILKEFADFLALTVTYQVIPKPDFTYCVLVNARKFPQATAATKKLAREAAAEVAVKMLRARLNPPGVGLLQRVKQFADYICVGAEFVDDLVESEANPVFQHHVKLGSRRFSAGNALSVSKQQSKERAAFMALQCMRDRLDPEVEELLVIGGIELNPGPQVVFRDRGLYQHYGLCVDNQVIHLNSEDILETAVTGKVSLLVEPYVPGAWVVKEDVDVSDSIILTRLQRLAESLGNFSVDFNCETVVNKVLERNVALQTIGFRGVAMLIVGVCLMYMMVPQGKIREMMTGITDGQFNNIQQAMGFLEPNRLKSICGAVVSESCRTIMKGILRAACYAFIVAQNPTIGTMVSTMILAGMDIHDTVTGFQDVVSKIGMVDAGDFVSTVATNEVGGDPEVNDYAKKSISRLVKWKSGLLKRTEGPDTNAFNKATLTSRNLEYWFQKLRDILTWICERINPTNVKAASQYLTTHQDLIVADIASVNDLVADVTDSGVMSLDQREKWNILHERMNKHHIAGMLAVSDRRNQLITSAMTALRRMPVGQKRPVERMRIEPIAIHLKGMPGQGKSMLMSRIAGLLAKRLDSDVYDHPPNCKHFDNYAGQKVHTIDEFLACRDEEDAAMILQLVSSSHCVLPMADISAKGMYYRGEFLITTSNGAPISDTKLRCSDALARRFKVYEVRAASSYLKTGLGRNKVFDAEKATKDGSYLTGACWEISEGSNDIGRSFVPMDLKTFVDDLMNYHKAKSDTLACMLRNPEGPDGDFGLFDTLRFTKDSKDPLGGNVEFLSEPRFPLPMCDDHKRYSSKFTDQVQTIWDSLTSDTAINVAVAIGTALAVLAAVSALCLLIWKWSSFPGGSWFGKFEEPVPETHGPYDGTVTRPVLKKAVVKRPEGADLPLHLLRNCVKINWSGGATQNGLAIGGRRILTNKHTLGSGEVEVIWRGGTLKFPSADAEWIHIEQDGDGDTDLVIVEYPSYLGYMFPDISRHFCDPDDGRDAILYLNQGGGIFSQIECRNVVVRDYQLFSGLGPMFGHIEYFAKTSKGDCGNPVLQKIKGTWKVVGLHNGGSSQGVACAMRVRLVLALRDSQGLVVDKIPTKPAHQPRRSRITKSPAYTAFPLEKQPSVLTPRDTRLMREVDDLVKDASGKYKVDVFQVDSADWIIARHRVAERLRSVCDLGYSVSIENAILGLDNNPIDASTSPGAKYVALGLEKKDLYRVSNDGVWVSQRLREDVDLMLTRIRMGDATTLFTAHLKDELRPLSKIAQGKTRVIEGCELDYVVAYRMIMSSIYRDIYASPTVQCGIAVGCDPLLDAQSWFSHIAGYSNWLAMDYSGFDGSLSAEIMREAVAVLSQLHEDPVLVASLHEPVVVSKHWVSDELWIVNGGMPSGSPCTSVLNSVVNLLMLEYLCVTNGVESYSSFVYGDDCVVAHNGQRIDGIQDLMLSSFGATVTPANKDGDKFYVDVMEVQFLKRNFSMTSVGVLGALTLDTLQQSIMWTRGLEVFEQQLMSVALELVAHGRDRFDDFSRLCNDAFRRNRSRYKFPRWEEALLVFSKVLGIPYDAEAIQGFWVEV